MYHTVLCRYNEIATKGNNRYLFENRLLENLRYFCGRVCACKVGKIRGRVMVTKKDGSEFTEEETQGLTQAMQNCFGLESFSFCQRGGADMESVRRMIAETAPYYFRKAAEEHGVSRVEFRTRARRSDKKFPLDSQGIEIEVATMLEEILGEDKIKVNLTNPMLSIGVEMREEGSMVYYETIPGPGGLPTGSNPSVLAMLSGGIDSPVACNMLMKRGCRCDFLTFHSFPYTPMESVDKVRRIAEIVCRMQRGGVLYSCNISPMQKLIRDSCNPRYRTVLYRRMMMRVAEKVCQAKNLSAIVTGDVVGQVASQTVENMSVINQAVPTLIIRPLCGMDKNETIERARKIGTFDTSIEPMIDSCTVFAPASPVLHAKPEDVLFEESKIPGMNEMIQQMFDAIETIRVNE